MIQRCSSNVDTNVAESRVKKEREIRGEEEGGAGTTGVSDRELEEK